MNARQSWSTKKLLSIRALTRRSFARFGVRIERDSWHSYRRQQQAAWLDNKLRAMPARPAAEISDEITCVVFTRDRAVQLNALLQSFTDMVKDRPKIYVVYSASDANHLLAYEQVFEMAGPEVVPVAEAVHGFRRTLLGLLDEIVTTRILFLVDDIVFLREVDLWPFVYMSDDLTVPSLRLGHNIVHSQIRSRRGQDAQVLPPVFLPTLSVELLAWSYQDAERVWAFPLSLDGHIFQTKTVQQMVVFLDFHNPNTLEAALQTFAQTFRGRLGICFPVSPIVNNPCNQVQQDIEHPVSGDMSADEFLNEWQLGNEIDVRRYYGHVNRGVHEELPIFLRRRVEYLRPGAGKEVRPNAPVRGPASG